MTYLWCLHGNLQLPSVWNELQEKLETTDIHLKLENLNAAEASDFHSWTHRFCDRVSRHPKEIHVLLGYSLGGRLALHALLECSSLWAGAVVIGADPGLKSESARTAQLQRDRAWAKRWRTEEWESLWQAWDAQGVFGGRTNTAQRLEAAYSREHIARVFEVFSKGQQADLRPRLAELTAPPILYLTGEDDSKYRALGDELAAICPALTHEVVEGAAHRVPWESPAVFTQKVRVFLRQIGPATRTS